MNNIGQGHKFVHVDAEKEFLVRKYPNHAKVKRTTYFKPKWSTSMPFFKPKTIPFRASHLHIPI